MKTKLALALATLAVAGCATQGTPGNTVAASGKGSYCAAARLVTAGDSLVCNWQASAKDACANTATRSMPKASVASGPEKGGICTTGERLVYVTTK